MYIETLIPFLLNISIWNIVKPIYLAGFIIQVIFAAVVLRQIYAMTKTVSSPINAFLKTLGFFYLVFSVIILAVMFYIL